MRKRNRFLALFLAAVLSISCSACGGSGGDDGASADSNASSGQDAGTSDEQEEEVDAFAAAQEKMNDVTSLNGTMVMEMDMEVAANGESQSMQTVTTMDMTTFSSPMLLKVEMTVDAGELGATDMSIYAEEGEDGNYTMYLYDGSAWQTQTVSMEDIEQYNAGNSMAGYLQDSYHFEAAGEEEVNGASAYKYTGALTGDDMKEQLLSSGALDSLSSLGVSSEQTEGMLDGLGDIPINLWIDKETYYPVKCDMDMTSVMDTLMAKLLESMGEQAQGVTMSIPTMKMSMTCSDYNAATEFTIPEEAKAN